MGVEDVDILQPSESTDCDINYYIIDKNEGSSLISEDILEPSKSAASDINSFITVENKVSPLSSENNEVRSNDGDFNLKENSEEKNILNPDSPISEYIDAFPSFYS